MQAFNLVLVPDPAVRTAASNVLQVGSALLAFAMGALLHFKLKKSAHELAKPWGFLAAAALAFLLGQAAFLVSEVVLRSNPYPGVSDVFFLAFYPFMVLGLRLMPKAELEGRDKWLRFFDIVVLTLTAGLLLWHLGLDRSLRELLAHPNGGAAVTIAYAVADVLLLGLAFGSLLRPPTDHCSFVPILLIALGALSMVCADAMQAAAMTAGEPRSGGLQDFGWVASSCCVALGATYQLDQLADKPVLGRCVRLRAKSQGIYVSLVSQLAIWAMVVVAVYWPKGSGQTTGLMVLGLAVLFLAVALRQVASLLDIEALHQQLHDVNSTLEQRVLERTRSIEVYANRLAVSENKFRTLLDAIPEPAFLTDADGIILAANAKFASYFARAPSELVGKDFVALAPDAVRAERKQRLEWVKANRKPLLFEQELDGQCYETRVSPVLDADGKVAAMAIIAFNVTERVQTQKRMAALIERLNLATRAGRFGIWDWNIKDDVLDWDDTMFEIYGASPDAFGGNYDFWLSSLVEEDREEAHRLAQRALQGLEPYDTVFRIRRGDGSVRYIKALGQLTFDEQGAPVRFTGINLDITEQKQAELALQEAQAELERRVEERTQQLTAVNRELEAFCYSVSHDLRAPIRAIAGFSRALQEDVGPQLNGEARDYLDRVAKAALRMNELIDALLKLSHVSRAPLNLVPVNLSALAEQIVADLRSAEPDRRIEFEIHPGIEAFGDPKLLEILMANLIQNAWKYTSKTEGAKVWVTTWHKDGRQVYTVSDNGVGFDMQHAEKLFDPFQRLHSAEEFPGTGVGLATVRRIVLRHGGHIWAESEPGRGAAFHFWLGS